ncbi:MAG: HAMP domain-containing protein [Burkholderiales bacterium]|nr:HAMP domain-containing protein [Burkholderiales bacterium]
MRLAPRSLLWRTFALIALLIVLALAAWVTIFRAVERGPRARQTADMVASVVNLTRAALLTAAPDLRRELLLELAQSEGIRVYPAEPDDRVTALDTSRAGAQLLGEEIRRQLGPGTRLATALDGQRGFWVSFRIAEDEYWVMLPRERVERKRALQWLGWAALALALALLGAYVIVFRLKRPLRALTQAAAEVGRGRNPAPVAESGPDEIRTLAHAFNQMSRDLARLEDDRALILAGVSHDLRTPLARLRLSIEMSRADPPLKQGMDADIDEIDRIIGQFLDFARSEGGEPAGPLDLAALARECVQQYRERGYAVEAEIGAVPELAGRALALKRMLVNLVDNAIRYGEKDVVVATRAEGSNAVVEVRDRGPGIPASEVDRLKQPFTRLEVARTGHSGSGLGLAIVERIARMHDATFELLPREGGGLIARVTLPADRC